MASTTAAATVATAAPFRSDHLRNEAGEIYKLLEQELYYSLLKYLKLVCMVLAFRLTSDETS